MNPPTPFQHLVQNDLSTLYWMFGFAVAFILLFIVARLLRNIAGGRVRQIEEFGMDFDSVASMLEKGMLSPEEAKKVKSVLARHFKTLYEKPKDARPDAPVHSAEEELAAALEAGQETPSAPAEPAPEPSAPPDQLGATDSASPAEPATQPPAPSSTPPPADDPAAGVPMDVVDMYRAGMITRDEFEALRRFYAARAQKKQ